MLEWIDKVIKMAKEGCEDVEFSAIDATRAEKEFLREALTAAVNAGATSVSVCDNAAEMLPDDFAAFTEEIISYASVPVGVRCANLNGLSTAAAILSVRHGAQVVKTNVDGGDTPLETFSAMVRSCGNNYGFTFGLRYTELNRIIGQIHRITDVAKNEKSALSLAGSTDNSIHLDKNDSREDIMSAAAALGYDLSEEDQKNVYDEFLRVAEKKNIGAKELDAIIASAALQVPSTYTLESYVINSSNVITSSAQIALVRDGNLVQGICMGDGPIDAAFLTVEQIIGHHYELDDFQIQSVTEGKEAMGSAIVKLRNDGKLYSGTGISTDIIGASIKAYLNAVNKIIYEETQA
jgi:2-isopropylmalate synthase